MALDKRLKLGPRDTCIGLWARCVGQLLRESCEFHGRSAKELLFVQPLVDESAHYFPFCPQPFAYPILVSTVSTVHGMRYLLK